MRKVILTAGISLDGYIARPNGSVDFLPTMTKDASEMMADLFAGIDTVIFGRKTLETRELKRGGEAPTGAWTTYVFSRSRPPGERDGLVFVNQSPAIFIRRLRKRPGKDILLMGGGELARSFLKADLVDKLFLGVVPILLGAGIPLFPAGFPQRDFKLIGNKTYSRGSIGLEYRRSRPKSKRRA